MAEQNAEQKVRLSISQILKDLSNGIDRKGIGAKYGLSTRDVNLLFQDPKLKGARVRVAPAFILTDDIGDDTPKKAPKQEAPVVSEAIATSQFDGVMSEQSEAQTTQEGKPKQPKEEPEDEAKDEAKEEPKDEAKATQGLW